MAPWLQMLSVMSHRLDYLELLTGAQLATASGGVDPVQPVARPADALIRGSDETCKWLSGPGYKQAMSDALQRVDAFFHAPSQELRVAAKDQAWQKFAEAYALDSEYKTTCNIPKMIK
jgi:hypothetical protein